MRTGSLLSRGATSVLSTARHEKSPDPKRRLKMSWITKFDEIESYRSNYRTLPADASLRAIVSYYWVIKCGSQTPTTPELLVPDGLDEIIFAYDSHFKRTRINDNEQSQSEPILHNGNSYVVGCKSYSVVCTKTTSLSMIGVKLKPGVLNKMFRIPMNECKEQPLNFVELKSTAMHTLEDQLHAAHSLNSIKQILDGALKRLLTGLCDKNSLIDHAICELFASQGGCRISDIAAKLSVTTRHLQKQFEYRVGVSPKCFARIIRFKAIYQALQNLPDSKTLPADIESLGIYDQSHLIREFNRFVGCTPQKLLNPCDNVSTNMLNICLQEEHDSTTLC